MGKKRKKAVKPVKARAKRKHQAPGPKPENTRFKYSVCPFCGYDRAEDWFASNTWYCPSCGKSNLDPDTAAALVHFKENPEARKAAEEEARKNKKDETPAKIPVCSLMYYEENGKCGKAKFNKETGVFTCCCGTPRLIDRTTLVKDSLPCEVCGFSHSRAFYCDNCNEIHSYDDKGRVVHMKRKPAKEGV